MYIFISLTRLFFNPPSAHSDVGGTIINPLDALGVGKDLAAIEQAMNGPAHLTSAGYNMLARAVVDTARRGDRAGQQQKKRFRRGGSAPVLGTGMIGFSRPRLL
jgi:hypothetical protein